jgi:hypothetical protein
MVPLSAVEFGVLVVGNRFSGCGVAVEGLYVWLGFIGWLQNLCLWCKFFFLTNQFLAVELLLLFIGPSIGNTKKLQQKISCNAENGV